ncbi:MAG: hypothetical protein AVDCRST_MAG27-3136, partial [uncultured Craurococcus sp.]
CVIRSWPFSWLPPCRAAPRTASALRNGATMPRPPPGAGRGRSCRGSSTSPPPPTAPGP